MIGFLLFLAMLPPSLGKPVFTKAHASPEGRTGPRVVLSWKASKGATKQYVMRLTKTDQDWIRVAELPPSATSWIDKANHQGGAEAYKIVAVPAKGSPVESNVQAVFVQF